MTLQTSKVSLLSTKVNPYVAQNCDPGYVWDPILRQCVPASTIISYAGVNISYYSGSHLLSFNDTNDVNKVLDQLDADYENYNTAYESQYPNATAIQLDSLDSVNNFDQLQSYKNFEAKFAGYTSQRRIFDNNEVTWLNNNMAGNDPDSLDYTVENSDNAICNNNYQLIIAGTTYQWTSTGLIIVGGTQSAIINSPTGSCFSNYRGGPPSWFYNSDRTRKCKLKVAVNSSLMRGEAKAKVKSFRKKSNGGWTRSRLDMRVRILGPLYRGNDCTLFENVDQSKPTQGYSKRYELKTLRRVWAIQANISPNSTFSGILYSNVAELSGTKTL